MLLFAGFLFACPHSALAELAIDDTAVLNGESESASVDAMFFIAKLNDDTVKPTSEQEVKQNLAGYSSKMIVANALVNPESTIAGGILEEFDENGVADYLGALPSNDDIKAACPEFDPDSHVILWYVVKNESDGWHVDGLLLDKSAMSEGGSGDAGDAGEGASGSGDTGEGEGGSGEGCDPGDTGEGEGEGEGGSDDAPATSDPDDTEEQPASPSAQIPVSPSVNPTVSPSATKPSSVEREDIAADSASPSPADDADAANKFSADSAAANGTAESASSDSDGAIESTASTQAAPSFSETLIAGMHIAGGVGMVALAGVVLIAAALSASKAAAVKACEERLKSGSKKSGGRR